MLLGCGSRVVDANQDSDDACVLEDDDASSLSDVSHAIIGLGDDVCDGAAYSPVIRGTAVESFDMLGGDHGGVNEDDAEHDFFP